MGKKYHKQQQRPINTDVRHQHKANLFFQQQIKQEKKPEPVTPEVEIDPVIAVIFGLNFQGCIQ